MGVYCFRAEMLPCRAAEVIMVGTPAMEALILEQVDSYIVHILTVDSNAYHLYDPDSQQTGLTFHQQFPTSCIPQEIKQILAKRRV